MSKRRWLALSFVCYALLLLTAFALFGVVGADVWTVDLVLVLVFAGFATWLQGMIGRCFDRSRPTALLTGGLGFWALLISAAWLFTAGPVGTRSDGYYGHQAVVEYTAWLARHGRSDAVVSGCRPLRTGLEPYGRPGFYSCIVDSSPHCLLRYRGFSDFGVMSATRCSYFAND